jgi:hypothetical protein
MRSNSPSPALPPAGAAGVDLLLHHISDAIFYTQGFESR